MNRQDPAPSITPNQARGANPRPLKVLDQVRSVLRLHHYSIHTERTYIEWIRRFIHFHRMESRADLAGGEAKIEAFLTDLAVKGNVAAATQNQAMNALVFLYRKVLEAPLNEKIDALRAERKVNVPVVMTREEVGKVISLIDGTPQLVVKLLYGSRLRVLEAVRLRVKDQNDLHPRPPAGRPRRTQPAGRPGLRRIRGAFSRPLHQLSAG